MRDKRILGIKFIYCAVCDREIRESDATKQRGLLVCKECVDVMDHEGET